MNKIDFERAGMLLDVVAKCVNIGPMMSSIQGEAGEELKAINDACRENALERANDRAAEEVARVQHQGVQLKAAEEVEADDGEDDTPIKRRA